MKLDFFARQKHYIDHLAPVWLKYPKDKRGHFFVKESVHEYALQELGPEGIEISDGRTTPPGDCPILTCAYGDMIRAARNEERTILSMEHGTGHAFGTAAYPDGRGKRNLIDLSLMPNEYTVMKSRSVRNTHCEVIGTPKTDQFISAERNLAPSKNPVIAIAFHWGSRNAIPPESGNAWEHYKKILPELARRYVLIGHGHPLAQEIFRPEFEKAGIEYVDDFREVARRADVYINDLSSTMYEFLTTGKPVIVLNAPWFRRNVHWGIRFWDYSDVGINVEGPEYLLNAIDHTLENYPTIHFNQRVRAVADLYPYLGHSAERAVEVLMDYIDGLEERQGL